MLPVLNLRSLSSSLSTAEKKPWFFASLTEATEAMMTHINDTDITFLIS